MTRLVAITTFDNPYDPFDEFDTWYAYDLALGYDSCGLLARIVRSSDELSELDIMLATERAIDDIINEGILGIYRKVTKEE